MAVESRLRPRARRGSSRLAVHFSSASDDWATPQAFFDELNDEFGFTLDVCASDTNAKCARYFTRDDGGLAQSWRDERCWMNPPYGREIGAWWHEYAARANEVRFIRGRLRFGNAKHSAPFPSAVVIFRPFGAND